MDRWFFYFLKKAIEQRKTRFIISAFSVMLTVSIVTAFMVISTGIKDKIGRQLSAYGANMVVSSSNGEIIPLDMARRIVSISKRIRDANYHLYGTLHTGGHVIELIGLDLSRLRGFRIMGEIPSKDNEILVGANLARLLGIKKGDILVVGKDNRRVRVTGIFEKGSDEDSSIVMDIREASRILGTNGVSAVLMNVDPSYIEQISETIKKRFPSLKVKTIRQIAMGERRLLRKIELLMVFVILVVLFSSSVALASTMGASVIERMREIGLMKAIGARDADIKRFFLYEAFLEGLAGSVLGIIAGIVMAELVSISAFSSYVGIKVLYLLPCLFAGLLLSALVVSLPVRNALKTPPSVILRGG